MRISWARSPNNWRRVDSTDSSRCGHLVEGLCQSSNSSPTAEVTPGCRRALGDRGRGRGDLGDGALQTPAEIGGHHQCGQRGQRDRNSDGDRGRVTVCLLGVELLIGWWATPAWRRCSRNRGGPTMTATTQWWPRRRRAPAPEPATGRTPTPDRDGRRRPPVLSLAGSHPVSHSAHGDQ